MLTDFRCFRHVRLETDARPVVLTGDNGTGKTSILEAVSLFAPGRGLRRARLDDLVRREGDREAKTWAIAARLRTPDGPVDLGTGRASSASTTGRERRTVRIDGRSARSQAEIAEILAMVWITPEMSRLFVDGASQRRRFLDRLVLGVDPAHATRVGAYQRAMLERSRLLRGEPADAEWLSALEEVMATHGVAVAAARRDMVARLNAAAAASGPFPRASMNVLGQAEEWLDHQPALAVEDRLKAALRDSRHSDAETGGATVGPHRSDLQVHHVAKGVPASACSTGEQKALLVAVVLAGARVQAAERGSSPMLLLDDVVAHLDRRHRLALFEAVAELEGQAWYAGTERTAFAPLDGLAQFFAVGGGDVRVAEGRG